MSNRRERRAQARSKAASADTIPLDQPNRDAPNHKTLLDIAAERQLIDRSPYSSHSNSAITTTKTLPDGSLSAPDSLESPSEIPATPYLDVALYTTTLVLLNFTLTVLVHHQYATERPSLRALFYESTVASPTPALLLILVAMLHPYSSHIITQFLFAGLSIVAGIWLVHASNEDAYLAVMSKAPPLGTLWVWAVIEMKWEWAAACLGLVAGWGWFKGYSVYWQYWWMSRFSEFATLYIDGYSLLVIFGNQAERKKCE